MIWKQVLENVNFVTQKQVVACLRSLLWRCWIRHACTSFPGWMSYRADRSWVALYSATLFRFIDSRTWLYVYCCRHKSSDWPSTLQPPKWSKPCRIVELCSFAQRANVMYRAGAVSACIGSSLSEFGLPWRWRKVTRSVAMTTHGRQNDGQMSR